MKRTNICCKCGSRKIIRIKGETGSYGAGNNIPAGFLNGTVNVTRYLCGECGYIEEWIDNIEDINKLKKKYNL